MVNRPKGLGTSEATRRSEGENTVGRLLLVAQRYSGDQVGSHVHKRGEGGRPRGSQGLVPEMEPVCWGPRSSHHNITLLSTPRSPSA